MPSARTAYLLYPSDALYPPKDLRLGERLLVDCALVIEKDDFLYPTPELAELMALDGDDAVAVIFDRTVLVGRLSGTLPNGVSTDGALSALASELIPDPERREAFLLALSRKHDDAAQRQMGGVGEDMVVMLAVEQLAELGRRDLAARVRRVSELSDQLGYDVVAPRLTGNRRLEVKTSGRSESGLFHFFLSRNEFDTGSRDADWALVCCQVAGNQDMELVGWCRAAALELYLPTDAEAGMWTTAELDIPVTLLDEGLPPAV